MIYPARVFVVPLGFSLISYTVGFIDRSHVVAEGNGLHGLVNSTAQGFPYFGSQGWAFQSRWLLVLLRKRAA